MAGTRREYPDRPLVGIGVIVLRGDTVLLVRRGREPGRGCWALPGGAQRIGETVEQAGRRELHEETGMQVGALHVVGCVDAIHRDAEGRIRFHYTIVDLAAAWHCGEPACGGDAEAAEFVAVAVLEEREVGAETVRMVALAQLRLVEQAGRLPDWPETEELEARTS